MGRFVGLILEDKQPERTSGAQATQGMSKGDLVRLCESKGIEVPKRATVKKLHELLEGADA